MATASYTTSMDVTIRDATVERLQYNGHDELRTHFAEFILAYNVARRLETLASHGPRTYGGPWLTLTL